MTLQEYSKFFPTKKLRDQALEELINAAFNDAMELKSQTETIVMHAGIDNGLLTHQLDHMLETITQRHQSFKNNLTIHLKHTVIAKFCSMIAGSEFMPIGNRTIESYCKEICQHYDLPYGDRVRQGFSIRTGTKKSKLRNEVEQKIFPIIPQAHAALLQSQFQ